jgi:hypothetical protein
MMDSAALDQLRLLAEEGPKRFSKWDASLFAAYCRTILPAVWKSQSSGIERTFAGLCALVYHGIGEGYLKGGPEVAPRNFLEFCIRDWLPEVLVGLPAEDRLPLLPRVWNLGEGLLREPEWVNGYVMSRIAELVGAKRPEAVLADILRPLLEPAPPARWEAPYRVTLLSLRQADNEFLPGEMQLAAPTVLVVSDRRRPVRLGIHLRREGQSVVVGGFGPNAGFPDEPPAVQVAWEGGNARIGDDELSLPFLAVPFRWALIRAGYLVASAVDSQKLWIVESAA